MAVQSASAQSASLPGLRIYDPDGGRSRDVSLEKVSIQEGKQITAWPMGLDGESARILVDRGTKTTNLNHFQLLYSDSIFAKKSNY